MSMEYRPYPVHQDGVEKWLKVLEHSGMMVMHLHLEFLIEVSFFAWTDLFCLFSLFFRLWHGHTANVCSKRTIRFRRSMCTYHIQLQEGLYVLLSGWFMQYSRHQFYTEFLSLSSNYNCNGSTTSDTLFIERPWANKKKKTRSRTNSICIYVCACMYIFVHLTNSMKIE